MSLNLGNPAFEAVMVLRSREEWKVFKNALHEQMSKYMHLAIETGDAQACGYAKGLRDIFWSIEMMEAGPGQGVVAARNKPAVGGKVG